MLTVGRRVAGEEVLMRLGRRVGVKTGREREPEGVLSVLCILMRSSSISVRTLLIFRGGEELCVLERAARMVLPLSALQNL